MSATIRIGAAMAICRDYRWESVPGDAGADEELIDLLNTLLDPDGPSGSDPNPDLTAARRALEVLGTGEIVAYDEWGDHDPDRVY